MKATTIILAAILTLSVNTLFADNDYVNTNPAPAVAAYTTGSFAPVPPAEASFEDAAVTPDLSGLFPAVPSEASFEDGVSADISVAGLAPLVPQVADFE